MTVTATNDNAPLRSVFENANLRRAGMLSTLGLAAAILSGCATPGLNTETCMGTDYNGIGFYGVGESKWDKDCGSAEFAETLLRNKNDPVGNALGFLLYLDQLPGARAQLEARLGQKGALRIEPETVATLLASPDISRYTGVQLYAKMNEQDRATVHGLLQERGIDPKIALTLNDDDRRAMVEAQKQAAALAERDVAKTQSPAPAAPENAPKQQCKPVVTNGRQIRFVCGGQ
jgi:hypothetical protein